MQAFSRSLIIRMHIYIETERDHVYVYTPFANSTNLVVATVLYPFINSKGKPLCETGSPTSMRWNAWHDTVPVNGTATLCGCLRGVAPGKGAGAGTRPSSQAAAREDADSYLAPGPRLVQLGHESLPEAREGRRLSYRSRVTPQNDKQRRHPQRWHTVEAA